MRKIISLTALVAALALAVPAALAAVTFDSNTGEGFVGKGDVQAAFGWNDARLQQNAEDVSFTYSEVGEFTVVCDGHSNASQNPRTFTNRELSLDADVAYDTRKNSQNKVTGFILNEFEDVITSGQACPSAWSITVSVTPNEDAGAVVGLFAHFDDRTVQLNWPSA